MKRLRAVVYAGLIAVMALMAVPAAASTLSVTNSNDGGAGSFRAAVVAANVNPSISSIHFQANLGTIAITDTIVYTGGQPLSIDGRGAAIQPAPNPATDFDLFVADGGGDLTLRRLAFRNSAASGIVVEVPADAEGQVSVSLFEVVAEDNTVFGLHIDDRTFASNASVGLDVAFSRFSGNATGGGLDCTTDADPATIADCDGIRVDEGGDGDIMATITNSVFTGNGSDGVELDENGPGGVALFVHGSTFDGNGQNPDDPDDGLDIDEDNDGSVWFRIVNSTFNGNTDDGLDIDESGEGDVHAWLVQAEALDNKDKGVNLAENDIGDLNAQVNILLATGNGFGDLSGDPGLRMREAGAGDFSARVVNSTFSNNDGAGIDFRQTGAGTGDLRLQAVTSFGNVGLPYLNEGGVTVIEVP